ncbi:MAG: ChbG/HpnK family deacetylase, partial [Erysipelotrichaceae bacterium]|nr:ChbG/HpnK family deacetylase [Erysipelotrichaceae bacterium]
MKILVQSDDYGFTKPIVEASCDSFDLGGIITCTGLFSNMPTRDYAVERIKAYPQICLGIDINVATGPCVADKTLLPHLVNQETGWFITTRERMAVDGDEFMKKSYRPYDEVMIEGKAQIEKFIELLGYKPEYITTHSTRNEPHYVKALHDLGVEYGIKFSRDMNDKYGFVSTRGAAPINPKEAYSLENQMQDEVEPLLEWLKANKDAEYVRVGGH